MNSHCYKTRNWSRVKAVLPGPISVPIASTRVRNLEVVTARCAHCALLLLP